MGGPNELFRDYFVFSFQVSTSLQSTTIENQMPVARDQGESIS